MRLSWLKTSSISPRSYLGGYREANRKVRWAVPSYMCVAEIISVLLMFMANK